MNLYGLIGYPLGHSFSKQYFTDKFQREGLADCLFESFPIESIEKFKTLVKIHPDLRGLGVTIPYKEQVLQFVEELSDEVKSIGATNSIKVSGNKLIAYNTDIIGFEQSFKTGLQSWHKKALVLGTGGASKAVQFVLKQMGIEFLIVTRNEEVKQGFISYSLINAEKIAAYNIIINCTPVGMYPNEHVAPDIPYHLLTKEHYLYDLIYKPAKTRFLEKGEEHGATILNGYDMLLIQAEASWKIWNS